MAPNQDPHGYQSTATDLRLAANADAVLVNGWRLEEGLIDDLENAAQDVPFVPVSAGIEARYYVAAGSGETSNRIDPHVWLSPINVIRWVDNIEQVLTTLNPGSAESYAERAEEYRARLNTLDAYAREQIEQIDISKRVMVTNHDAFGYFADTYGLSVIGTIIPGDSSLAEPGSRDLADLVDEMGRNSVCAIFVEQSASQRLASQLADELEHCSDVQVVSLYSGALGEEGSGAETYLTMMRANIDMIVSALSSGPDPLDTS
jgi:zinc/manganese transport system substrate-binding protein